MDPDETCDVIVVGGGNAGMTAAHAARERGCRVVVLEKAPPEWRGGNSYFTAGAIRFAHTGTEHVRSLLGAEDDEFERVEIPPYREDEFVADMRRVTRGMCDPALVRALAADSASTIGWLREKGIRFRLMPERQAYEVDGRLRFWGGLSVGVVDGGEGLIDQHYRAAADSGIAVRYEAAATGLIQDADGRITGVTATQDGRTFELHAGAVVLAAGGFEADARLRASYLGPGWDLSKVRGTPFNTGEVLVQAIARGGQSYGHWSGCHAIQWDADAPASGDRTITNRFSRQGYPLGIVVNRDGRRFIDEGADFRNYTYARYGAEVLRQPGAVAAQVFDARTVSMLSAVDYATATTSRATADSIRRLAEKLEIDPDGLERTVADFNAATNGGPFDPTIKDGLATRGLAVPKSNWAVRIERPPFTGYKVACGITFTFGGLRVDDQARVLGSGGRPVRGLHAAGELVGGLFFHNYPGGSGLAAGAVFGRRAGWSAAAEARRS